MRKLYILTALVLPCAVAQLPEIPITPSGAASGLNCVGTPLEGYVATWNSSTGRCEWAPAPGATGGEANDLQDFGAVGVGFRQGKSGVLLQLRKIDSANNLASFDLSGDANNFVRLTINPSNFPVWPLTSGGTGAADAATARLNLGALSIPTSNAFVVRTNVAGATRAATLQGTAGQISISLPSGVLGDPVFSIDPALNLGGLTSTNPFKTGTMAARPATCTQYTYYSVTDPATAGEVLYRCEAGNTWELVGDGGAGETGGEANDLQDYGTVGSAFRKGKSGVFLQIRKIASANNLATFDLSGGADDYVRLTINPSNFPTWPVTSGGTGAADAATARVNLGTIANPGSNAFVVRTNTDGFTRAATLQGTVGQIAISNPAGVLADPTFSMDPVFDLSTLTSTNPFKTGTLAARPATCTPYTFYSVTNPATPGQALYRCRAGNIWDLIGDGGEGAPGGAALITEIDGGLIGQQPNLNFQQSTGIVITGTESAPRTNVQIAANLAVLQSRANDISGADRVITLTSSATRDFVGTTGVSFPSYPTTIGMGLTFTPNFSCAPTIGPSTLALNGLAAKRLVDPNGAGDMTCTNGRTIQIVYDPSLDAGAGAWQKLASTFASDLTAGTLLAARLPTPTTGAMGGVRSLACSAGFKLSAIGTDGIPVCTAESASGATNGFYATNPIGSGFNAVTQTDSTVIKLWRHNIAIGFNATEICALTGVTAATGQSRFGLYSIAASGATATKILDSGDVVTDTLNALACGSFASTLITPGSYFFAWASNINTVALFGNPVTMAATGRAFLQSGPQPILATGGTWAGPTNALPATLTVDTTTSPAGLWPLIILQ